MNLTELRHAAYHAGKKLRQDNEIAYLVRLLRCHHRFLDSIITMHLSEQENPYFTSDEEYVQLVLDIQKSIHNTSLKLGVLREGL
jgi:hypothetical protein